MKHKLRNELEPYLQRLVQEQDVFTYDELLKICEERYAQMGKKTKESSKAGILMKYLSKMLEIDLIDDEIVVQKATLKESLARLPKWLLHSSADRDTQPIVTITGLCKQLGSTVLFVDAQAQVLTGSKVALIGQNGAGKSTLFKLILGREKPDAGDIVIAPDTKIGFLSQEILWENHERTLLEEMYTTLPEVTARMHRLDEITQRIEQEDPESVMLVDEQSDIIERLVQHDGYVLYDLQKTILGAFGFSDEHFDLPLSHLSGGEQTKVQIAKFVLQQVDLLVLDEPTNHLDIAGIVFLEQFCAARGKSLLCISHDKRFLNTVFNEIMEIQNHQIDQYKGSYDDYLHAKMVLHAQQEKAYKNQQKYLKQQEDFINRFRYKDSKAKQVQSRIKLLDKLEKVTAPENVHTARAIAFRRGEKRLPEIVLRAEGVEVGYTTPLVTLPRTLEVTKAMHVGIIGENGVGKTTLINALLTGDQLLAGNVSIPASLHIGSYGQIVEAMDKARTVEQELTMQGVGSREIYGLLGSLAMAAEKLQQTIATLSGGEKAKVALMKMLLQKPDIIVMDEPTNHLDMLTKESILLLLQEFTGVSIIISHDRDFLAQVSTCIWHIHNHHLTVYEDVEQAFAQL